MSRTPAAELHRIARLEPRQGPGRLLRIPLRIRVKFVRNGTRFEGTPCWVWTAAVTSRGYGSAWSRGAMRQAHLVVYEHVVRNGRRLRGKRRELDHRCRNRLCVNPAHLEPVTRSENNRRSTCWHHLHSAKNETTND